ncbi:MJ1477/TM1410 family putative glycoside hydrolase [Pyrococcus yayanosii]|uniref:Possible cysteinyl-tRNA synthetase n=1 Tax=Pyrococcus yayanosii (strain CH1 / JCM 16557) TaxID=529709 RepID=F8AHN1_PYRYC|nr:MJ1477/TM1410 family putative glycoside hydrolase [Pyrococcus yayanosii]AEH25404.1 possible cysteinyl-tRNA synthetase [Pyrococcus yayanosii CH1]
MHFGPAPLPQSRGTQYRYKGLNCNKNCYPYNDYYRNPHRDHTIYTTPKLTKAPQIESIKSWAYQFQNADPDEIANSGFDLVVIDYSRDGTDEGAYSREDIEKLKNSGIIPIAYISIGEAEDYRFYWREEWNENPPAWLGEENPEWSGCYAVKYWDEAWKNIIFSYLDRIIAQGFMGVYLDRVDEFEYWAKKGYDENWTAKRMIEFILEIANYTRTKVGPNFMIIPQNGERLLDYDDGKLLKVVSGWASEDVFYNGLEPSPWKDEKVSRLDKMVNAGKIVLVVDYVDDGTRNEDNLARILDFRRKALEHGYIPYAAIVDRELDELNVIPGIQP